MAELLLTMDLEFAADHDEAAQGEILDVLHADLARLGAPCTVFVTADAAQRYGAQLRRWAADGHELGCHGVHHSADEDYARLPGPTVDALVSVATRRIEAATGCRPRAFRGPRMTTSSVTRSALARHGYEADLSVSPQRLDIWGSPGATLRGWAAPRWPWRQGPITVIPLSGVGVPFVSGTLHLLGSCATRALHAAICAEARGTRAPVVFMFHSYELTPYLGGRRRPAHHRLYRGGAGARRRRLLDFLQHLLAAPGTTARTVADWLEVHR